MDVRDFRQSEGFKNLTGAGQFAPTSNYRPLTKFEVRGHNLGHGVWDVLFVKKRK
jgi:tRNA (guanine-N7-)-methyltransferase